MKYSRLTKEQFEELHQEFINFLASQSITAEEWQDIKKNKPQVAEDELDVFSDLIWEGVLTKVDYLEHISPQHIFLFRVDGNTLNLISIQLENKLVDLTTSKGYQWLQENLMDDAVNLYSSSKTLKADKNADLFALIQQGAVITKGELYEWFAQFVS
ncbi:MAG: DUF6495 family protein [Leeuwenhoekiella sp.]